MDHQFKADVTCTHEDGSVVIENPYVKLSLILLNENDYHFYYYLEMLKKHNLINYRTPLLQLIPLTSQFNFKSLPLDRAYQLSRFAICKRIDEQLIVETPLAPVRILLEGSDGFQFFATLHKPHHLKELCDKFPHYSAEVIQETLELLLAGDMIESEKEPNSLIQWDVHDLYFHFHSRNGRHRHPSGGTYHLKEVMPLLPHVKPCSERTLIPLEKPISTASPSFFQTLEARRSIRTHGSVPITLAQLSAFLFHSARIKDSQNVDDQCLTNRPSPNGGARHELEINLIVHNCTGLDSGVYHYHPLEHALCTISPLTEQAEQLLKQAQMATLRKTYPQVLIIISARFQRTFWKYQAMGYALILKNVGALMQTFYLTATALDLAPCAVGNGDSELFCQVMETDYCEETSVGEFILGSTEHRT